MPRFYAKHRAGHVVGFGEGDTLEEAKRAAIADAHDRPQVFTEIERKPILDVQTDEAEDALMFWAIMILIGLAAGLGYVIFGMPDLHSTPVVGK